MIGIEEERLLKLQRTSVDAKKCAYSSQYNEGTFTSSRLCHARFGHLNYDNIHFLKRNGVIGLPTIPRKLKQYYACILGKHRKQTFHDFVSRACRKIALIHSYLCGSLPIPSQK